MRRDVRRVQRDAKRYRESVRIEVRGPRGGRKLRRFMNQQKSGEVRRRYMRYIEDGLHREYLPEMRQRVPRRTGRLAKSFQLDRSKRGFELRSRGIGYATLVAFKHPSRGARTVREISAQVVRERLPGIAARAIRRANREAAGR